MEIGDLISIHEDALKHDKREADGFLWIVTEIRSNPRKERVDARSIATGEEWVWFKDEYEVGL